MNSFFKIVLFFLLYLPNSICSQDLIFKKTGDEIKAKVVEILKTEIKYKKFENLGGPIYSIDLSEVFMIRYENGSKDVFNTIESTSSQARKEPESKLEIGQSVSIDGIDIGRVAPTGNKLVFINSVPVAKYEVVFTFQNLMDFQDLPNPIACAQNSIRNANIEAANQSRLYDAIICQNRTERDVAIKFINPAEDKSLCRVSKINGVLAFVGAEPINQYSITGRFYSIHQSGDNQLFGNYQATEVFFINKAIEWGRRKKVDFDALIYNNSIKGNDLLIKF
jgi:hypothetical protein